MRKSGRDRVVGKPFLKTTLEDVDEEIDSDRNMDSHTSEGSESRNGRQDTAGLGMVFKKPDPENMHAY